MNERIKIEDDLATAFHKMSEGNAGALNVLCAIMKIGEKIDPQCDFPFLHILGLDTIGVYGHRIWMLYKDVCDHDLATMIGLLRAHQLGFIDKYSLNRAIDNCGKGIDVAGLMKKVREELEEFTAAKSA